MSVLTLQQPVEVLQSRPWLALYGVMLRPRRQAAHLEEADLAPIQRLFPEEMMNTIFSYLGPYELGRAACVCRQWRHLSEHHKHWQAACQQAYGACHKDVTCSQDLVRKSYRCSWRRLFLECPHLRFDGLYASRNTYIRQGVSEWRREKGSCFLVTYFRYFRFFPDGTLLYRTSPLTIGKVAKSMMRSPCEAQQKQKQQDQHVFSGRYVIKVGGNDSCYQERGQHCCLESSERQLPAWCVHIACVSFGGIDTVLLKSSWIPTQSLIPRHLTPTASQP
eukprot:GHUV01026194.1.p1 GENE.GHUV01026194.1~~GHUV01026194.1.p1  ORF type:complete len:277 (+),score=60.16 GHUV01026194.1:176-1006(+)